MEREGEKGDAEVLQTIYKIMKVISLNCWGGKGGVEKLSEFFSRHQDIDVFCLQEAWHNDRNNRAEEWGQVGTIVNDIQV